MDIKIVTSTSKLKLPIIGWLIQLLQKTNYSHMSLHFRKHGRPWVVADVTGDDGFRCNPIEKWSKKHSIVSEKILQKTPAIGDFMEWMIQHLGKDYDQSQVFGLMLQVLGLVTNNAYGHNYKKLTCNELILSFVERFYNIEIGDSDNYDLNATWNLMEKI